MPSITPELDAANKAIAIMTGKLAEALAEGRVSRCKVDAITAIVGASMRWHATMGDQGQSDDEILDGMLLAFSNAILSLLISYVINDQYTPSLIPAFMDQLKGHVLYSYDKGPGSETATVDIEHVRMGRA